MSSNPISALGNAAGKIIRDFKYEIMVGFVGAESINLIQEYLTNGRFTFDPIPQGLVDLITPVIGEAEREIGQPLFELLVAAPSGAQLSREPGAQEATAVAMVERMLGFAIGLPFGIARLKMLLKATMGENAGDALAEALDKIPEEIGINWALGNVLDRILEVAAGQPIEEAIAEQTRPQRMEWQQIRALARQHVISDADLTDRLARSGWRDEDIDLLKKIDNQPLAIAQLQSAYQYGLISEADVRQELDTLGFDGRSADVIVELYLKKAETAGGDQLRAVAQKAYLDGHITEATYRGYLAEANVPQTSIDLEVKAANIVKSFTRQNLSVGQVKSEYVNGLLDQNSAIARLVEDGYSDADALLLVKDWQVESSRVKTGLSEQRILSYLLGGVIDKTQAYDLLVGNGIASSSAAFLVAHPSAAGPVKAKQSSAATIIAAFKDGILTQDEAQAKLVAINVSPEAAALEIRVANFAVSRATKPKQPHKSLSEAQVLEAFKQGLVADTWALRELQTLGWSMSDAELIVATEETKLNGNAPTGWTKLI